MEQPLTAMVSALFLERLSLIARKIGLALLVMPRNLGIALFLVAGLLVGAVLLIQRRTQPANVAIVSGDHKFGPPAYREIIGPDIPQGLFHPHDHAFGHETGFYAVGGFFVEEETPTLKDFCLKAMVNDIGFQDLLKALIERYPKLTGAYRQINVPLNTEQTFRIDYKSGLKEFQQQFFVRRNYENSLPEIWETISDGHEVRLMSVVGYMAWVISPKHSYGLTIGENRSGKYTLVSFASELNEAKIKEVSTWKAGKIKFQANNMSRKYFNIDRMDGTYFPIAGLLDSPYRSQPFGIFSPTSSINGSVEVNRKTMVANVDGYEMTVPNELWSPQSTAKSNFAKLISSSQNGDTFTLTFLQPPVRASEQVLIGKQD